MFVVNRQLTRTKLNSRVEQPSSDSDMRFPAASLTMFLTLLSSAASYGELSEHSYDTHTVRRRQQSHVAWIHGAGPRKPDWRAYRLHRRPRPAYGNPLLYDRRH